MAGAAAGAALKRGAPVAATPPKAKEGGAPWKNGAGKDAVDAGGAAAAAAPKADDAEAIAAKDEPATENEGAGLLPTDRPAGAKEDEAGVVVSTSSSSACFRHPPWCSILAPTIAGKS